MKMLPGRPALPPFLVSGFVGALDRGHSKPVGKCPHLSTGRVPGHRRPYAFDGDSPGRVQKHASATGQVHRPLRSGRSLPISTATPATMTWDPRSAGGRREGLVLIRFVSLSRVSRCRQANGISSCRPGWRPAAITRREKISRRNGRSCAG